MIPQSWELFPCSISSFYRAILPETPAHRSLIIDEIIPALTRKCASALTLETSKLRFWDWWKVDSQQDEWERLRVALGVWGLLDQEPRTFSQILCKFLLITWVMEQEHVTGTRSLHKDRLKQRCCKAGISRKLTLFRLVLLSFQFPYAWFIINQFYQKYNYGQ